MPAVTGSHTGFPVGLHLHETGKLRLPASRGGMHVDLSETPSQGTVLFRQERWLIPQEDDRVSYESFEEFRECLVRQVEHVCALDLGTERVAEQLVAVAYAEGR